VGILLRRFFISGIVFILLIWAGGFCYFVSRVPSHKDQSTKTDAIIVLTGGKGRVGEAVGLFSKDMASKLLITGVGKKTTIEEIILMSQDLTLKVVGPVKDKITLGRYATNTKENAQEASLWMSLNDFKTLRLVTSNYHMQRSLLEFKSAMPDVEIIAHPVRSKKWWNLPATIPLLMSEYHKYIIVSIIDLIDKK